MIQLAYVLTPEEEEAAMLMMEMSDDDEGHTPGKRD
jgi:hypothetical protein